MVNRYKTPQEIIFLSFVEATYSRTSTLLAFQSKNYVKSFNAISPKFQFMIRDLLNLRGQIKRDAIVVIGSPSHKTTLFARIILKNKVVLDAGWPLSDGVISRGLNMKTMPKFLKSLFIDFVSFQAAGKILVESRAQAKRVHRLFLVPKRKIIVSLTGLNEEAFQGMTESSELIKNLRARVSSLNLPLTILFRGKLNNESGINLIMTAANLLSNEATFLILSGGEGKLFNKPANCIEVSNVTNKEMREIYEISDIVIGQVSNHPRLGYTIPHKAFEAAYFSKCYITAKSSGVGEIFDSNSAVMIENVCTETLVAAIRSLKYASKRIKYEKNISQVYSRQLCQSAINSNFESTALQ